MIGTPSPLTCRDDVGAESVLVGERRARLVDARVDRPAEMLQEGAEQAPVQFRPVACLIDDRARGAGCRGVSDAAQPRPGRQRGARLAKRLPGICDGCVWGSWRHPKPIGETTPIIAAVGRLSTTRSCLQALGVGNWKLGIGTHHSTMSSDTACRGRVNRSVARESATSIVAGPCIAVSWPAFSSRVCCSGVGACGEPIRCHAV